MVMYYKFKSAKDYDSFQMDGHFISLGQLKEKLFKLKLGRGTDFDLVVTNAQTNEEYLDEGMLIPKNTSVLIRRVPGLPRKPIVTDQEEPIVENNCHNVQALKGADQSAMKYAEDVDWDDFGNDIYAISDTVLVESRVRVQDALPVISREDEESKIKALDWHGFGGIGKRTPPQGSYICHRCKMAGHFIQHCPTNGDPNFDIKRVKPAPTGIPRSMLMATPDGSYALPTRAVAVLKPDERGEIEGIPSTHSSVAADNFPPELHCPLCKQVMKDAVFTSKCCFSSFCDECIRDHTISKSMCVCGATSVLADDLLPNKTLRDTIKRMLESSDNSSESGGTSAFRVPVKVLSPTQSAASKGQHLQREESSKIAEIVEENKSPNVAVEQPKVAMQYKPISGEAAGRKKKRRKICMEAEMQWRGCQTGFNPYWNGMQPGLDWGFMPPYGAHIPYMGHMY